MDELISSLEELTESIIVRLDHVAFEELAQFVDDRQVLMHKIITLISKESPTPLQRGRMEEILKVDALILGRMNSLKQEAGNWLQQRGQARIQRSVYESTYSTDSILLDKRK